MLQVFRSSCSRFAYLPSRVLYPLLVFALFSFAEEFRGTVVAVLDGDTVEVLVQRESKRVRLFGIDASEKGLAFGRRAGQATGTLAFDQTVKVVSHGTHRYGRILGEVVLPDGSILNERLVEQGWAWHYTRYSNSPRLAELELAARRARRGLWADPQPIPPWEYRDAQRRSTTIVR